MTPIYSLNGIDHAYGGRTVVDINRLEIFHQEILAIVGPSGAGKSTLLRLLAFLEPPRRGNIVYIGRQCDDNWPDLTARRSVTMVFQKPFLLRRSVIENVGFGLELRGQADRRDRIQRILEQLGLADLSREPAHTLSGGEMERVALARALVLRPDVLLLDEPTANLDPFNIKLIENIITRANEKHSVTVVMVTHNIFQARRLAHRVGLMLAGKLIEVSETEAFFERPSKEVSAAFVRGEIVY